MKYEYPKITNTLSYKRTDARTVEITDYLSENSFAVDIEVARFIRRLDGHTNPRDIDTALSKTEQKELMDFLYEYELVKDSDVTRLSLGTKTKALVVPKMTPFLRFFARLWNGFLMLSWLPVLYMGIYMFVGNKDFMNFDGVLWGYGIGLLCGLAVHEIGHAFAGISYGARVYEMGVMVTYFVMFGAYAMIDDEPVKNRLQRAQIYSAGIESNFLLCGIFLILAAVVPILGGMFCYAALVNAALGLFNLMLIRGIDGAAVLSELFGVSDIIGGASEIILNKRKRQQTVRKSGGYATVAVCYILIALQIMMPILLIINVLEVVACFV